MSVNVADKRALLDMLAVQKAKDPLDMSMVSAGTVTALIERLIDVTELFLEAAAHLEYCGYGDKWERECAKEEGLPQRIRKMVEELTEEVKP